MRNPDVSSLELFAGLGTSVELGPGVAMLRGFAAHMERELLKVIAHIAAIAPFRHLITPGGYRMSVAMTNCGEFGWVSDASGYRYTHVDPLSERNWPTMPGLFARLAAEAAAHAGYPNFRPDACLVNRYEPESRLSLHRDHDERDAAAPIVSVSLGVSAVFLWGGLRRKDRTRRTVLNSGDVVVWGGESRYVYHGVARILQGLHPLTGNERFNLTFRKT